MSYVRSKLNCWNRALFFAIAVSFLFISNFEFIAEYVIVGILFVVAVLATFWSVIVTNYPRLARWLSLCYYKEELMFFLYMHGCIADY